MENSSLLWTLIILVFILMFLRIFGRNLPNKISLKKIYNKWIYLGGSTFLVVLISIGFSSWLPEDSQKYKDPRKPGFFKYHNTLWNIRNSNPRKIKSIKQVVCIARDSLGEIVGDELENSAYFDNESIKFDEKGRVIESDKKSIPRDEYFFKKNYIYDGKFGELLETIIIAKDVFEEGIIHQRRQYKYSRGQIIEELTYRNGVYYDSVVHNYNSDNLIEEITHFESDSSGRNARSLRDIYLYYDDKKVVAKYNEEDQLTDQETFLYDKEGNCIKHVLEKYQEPFKYHRLYTYDKHKRVTTIEEYKNDILVYKHKYSYEGPKLILEETWSFENEMVSYYQKNTVEYNQNGHIVFESDSSFTGGELTYLTSSRIELKYAQKDPDNWVERVEYINGLPRYKVIRTIEYF